MTRLDYNESKMPLGPDRYDNNSVQQHTGGHRKYGMQSDDEYYSENQKNKTKAPIVIRRQENVGENERGGQDGVPQPRNPQTNYKKMERGISKAAENEFLINEARSKLERDFGTLGIHSDVSRSIKEYNEKVNDSEAINSRNDIVTETTGRAWVKNRYDKYEDTSGSSGNTSNSPTHLPESGSNSDYRIDSDNIISSTGNFIENPVYTFILPDLTIYPGK